MRSTDTPSLITPSRADDAGPGVFRRSPRRSAPTHRRGTVMVFVLGILTLLALVGIGLIASTRMDAKRVDNQSNITSTSDSINAVVNQIRETLRQDIWGASNSVTPLDNSLQPGSGANPLGFIENNEPYDGYFVDPWIGPSMPYNHGPVPVGPIAGTNLFTGNLAAQAVIVGVGAFGELDVLVWPTVSYSGGDLMLPRTNPTGAVNEFVWPYNTRNNVTGQVVRYGPAAPPALGSLPVNPSLTKVPVMQTWPPLSNSLGQPGCTWAYSGGQALPMVPGSTTNVSIRLAKSQWDQFVADGTMAGALAAAGIPTSFTPKFPYFDTNGDGIVDLYDADGDGVPDSPISFVLDGNAGTPDRPSKLYAVIRVIDHGAMLNANVASSFAFSQNPPTNLMFDESNSNLQRRGRRATELLLDDVCHTRDIWSLGTSNRAWQLVNYRTRNTSWINDPFNYDLNVVRRDLIGGLTGNFGYRLFGLADEASLRHRFSLVPAAYANYTKAPPTNGVGYDKIDTALPWSTLWSNNLIAYSVPNSYPTLSYEQTASRWTRNNADFQQYGFATYYDGWDFNPSTRGWRKLYTEDEKFSIRRTMLTTVSRDVALPPTDLTLNPTTNTINQLPQPGSLPVQWLNPVTGTPLTLNMNDAADPWPMVQGVPTWMKLQPIDLNLTGNVAAQASTVQAAYMRYMASAMFLALGGVTDASGLNVTAAGDRLSHSFQFAANVGDYRDSDDTPTMLQLPNGSFIFGAEKQPFFTEAFSRVEYNTEDGTSDPTNANDDDWFDAVELYIPPTWLVNVDRLYLRTPGSSVPTLTPQGIPLNTFLRAGQPPVLDGNGASTATNIDTRGAYFVFCGPTTEAPSPFPDGTTANSFFVNGAFQPDHDTGSGTAGKVELVYYDPAVPNSTHVLDTIDFKAGNGNIGPTLNPGARFAERDTMPGNGTSERFSLARSTKGWRFTIARYKFKQESDSTAMPLGFETLGSDNLAQTSTDPFMNNMPEMVWPSRSKRDHTGGTSEVAGGFSSGLPYEAFDSVIDISRIPLVANVIQPGGVFYPATQALWDAVSRQMAASGTGPDLAVAAAHIDFANATRVAMTPPNYIAIGTGPAPTGPQQPWSWRLLRYLTVTGHPGDRVDNDGDGVVDNANEGINTLFRMAGRINVNTAPATVLRSVPSMSLLPDSLRFTELLSIAGSAEASQAQLAKGNPYGFYASNAQRFWDFASAIVAAREGRDVRVRQADGNGDMQLIATASPAAGVAGGRTFESIGELMEALSGTNVGDTSGANDKMFRIDRFTGQGPNVSLTGHRANVNGDVAFGLPIITPTPQVDYRAFSPDFRYRKAFPAAGEIETIEYTPIGNGDVEYNPANYQNGGIRGRDIYLSRWANLLTTRSDVFTAYIALIDEDGKYVRRAQVTFDRSNCFGEQRIGGNVPTKAVLPDILLMEEGSYSDDTR